MPVPRHCGPDMTEPHMDTQGTLLAAVSSAAAAPKTHQGTKSAHILPQPKMVHGGKSHEASHVGIPCVTGCHHSVSHAS
jgi:hypothetical protein